MTIPNSAIFKGITNRDLHGNLLSVMRQPGWEVGLGENHVYVLVTQSCPTFAAPYTVVHQVPLSMDFFRQEHWSEQPSLLQGIFPTQGRNSGLLHCRHILYPLSHKGSLKGRMETCLCMAESLHCLPETIQLLLSCTPTQNKKLKINKDNIHSYQKKNEILLNYGLVMTFFSPGTETFSFSQKKTAYFIYSRPIRAFNLKSRK